MTIPNKKKTIHFFIADVDGKTLPVVTATRNISVDDYVEIFNNKTNNTFIGKVIQTHWFTDETDLPCSLGEMMQLKEKKDCSVYMEVFVNGADSPVYCEGGTPRIHKYDYIKMLLPDEKTILIGRVNQIKQYYFEKELPCPIQKMCRFIEPASKEEIREIEDSIERYVYCSIQIEDKGDLVYYRSTAEGISIGDIVLVDHILYGEKRGIVKKIERVSRKTAPSPVERTRLIKSIISRAPTDGIKIEGSLYSNSSESENMPFETMTVYSSNASTKKSSSVFFDILEMYYPEHKVFALDSIDKELRKRLNDLYKSAQYPSAKEYLEANGYKMISGDAVKSIRNTVSYTPGNEPEIIKGKVESMLRRLEEYYPDHVIPRGIQVDHKNLAQNISGLYQWLGYTDAKEMLTAYGFDIQYGEGGRPQTNDYQGFVDMLRERYANAPANSLSAIRQDFPDYSAMIKTMGNMSNQLFGMSFGDYLQSIGVIVKKQLQKEYNYLLVSVDDAEAPVPCVVEFLRSANVDDYIEMIEPKTDNIIKGRVVETCFYKNESDIPCPVDDMLIFSRTVETISYLLVKVDGSEKQVPCFISKIQNSEINEYIEFSDQKTGDILRGYVIKTVFQAKYYELPCPKTEMFLYVRTLVGSRYLMVTVPEKQKTVFCTGPIPNHIATDSFIELTEGEHTETVIGQVKKIIVSGPDNKIACPLTEMWHFVRTISKTKAKWIEDSIVKYIYCNVQIQGRSDSLYYISPFENIEVGDIVLVNHSWYGSVKGVVRDIKHVSKNTAPFPVGRTKPIERILQSKTAEEARIKEKTAAILQNSQTVPFVAKAVDPTPDQQFNKMTYFAGAVFRGLEFEVNSALQSLNISVLDTEKRIKACGHGIFQFQCESAKVPQIIRDYPNLKGICFAEDWNRNNVYLAYSESGYAAVTSLRLIGSCDFYMRDRWPLIHDPAEKEFTEKTLHYVFEEAESWEAFDYVLPDGKMQFAGGHHIPAAPYKKRKLSDPCGVLTICFPENEQFFDPTAKKRQQIFVGIPEQIQGNTFVVTGDLVLFPDREDLKEIIVQAGGKLTGSVSSRTTLLITNDPDCGTTKNRKAKELGIPVISEEMFITQYLKRDPSVKQSGYHIGSFEEYTQCLKTAMRSNGGKRLSDDMVDLMLIQYNLGSDWNITPGDIRKDIRFL